MIEQVLSVRAAKESDVPILADNLNAIILAGHTTALEKTLTHSEFAERFILGRSVLCCHVAIEAETSQPVGFQILERDDDTSGERIDIATYARPEPKIAGVGTSLFAATIERAKVLVSRHRDYDSLTG